MKLGIFKNATYLLIAQGLVKAIAFVYTVFLARNLGVESFGLYAVALTFFSVLAAISDFGISNYLIRELSQDRSKISTLLPCTLLLRIILVAISFGLLATVMYFVDPDKTRVSLILLAVLAIFPQGVAMTIDSLFIALQKLSYSAVGLVFLSATNALLGVWLISQGFGAVGAVAAMIFANLAYATLLIILMLVQKINPISSFPEQALKKTIAESLPLALLGVLGLLFFKVDTLMLSYIKGPFDTGIYSAAYRFLEAVVFIPSAVSAAVFPVIANLSAHQPQEVARVYKNSLKVMLTLSLLVVAGYFLLLPWVIANFLPQYLESIRVVKILTLAIPFIFLVAPQALVLLSDKQYLRPLINISIFNLSFNVILNLLLIPQFSYLGASLATVLSYIVGFLIFYFFIKRQLSIKIS